MTGTSWHIETVNGGESERSYRRKSCYNCEHIVGHWCERNKVQITNNNAYVCPFFKNMYVDKQDDESVKKKKKKVQNKQKDKKKKEVESKKVSFRYMTVFIKINKEDFEFFERNSRFFINKRVNLKLPIKVKKKNKYTSILENIFIAYDENHIMELVIEGTKDIKIDDENINFNFSFSEIKNAEFKKGYIKQYLCYRIGDYSKNGKFYLYTRVKTLHI